jgi:hypothetical protein
MPHHPGGKRQSWWAHKVTHHTPCCTCRASTCLCCLDVRCDEATTQLMKDVCKQVKGGCDRNPEIREAVRSMLAITNTCSVYGQALLALWCIVGRWCKADNGDLPCFSRLREHTRHADVLGVCVCVCVRLYAYVRNKYVIDRTTVN